MVEGVGNRPQKVECVQDSEQEVGKNERGNTD